MKFSIKSLYLLTLPLFAAGCSTVFNPVGSGDYGCPGMPMGVVCKTPASVYNSTNGQIPSTDFDTPLGAPLLKDGKAAAAPLTQSIGQYAPSSNAIGPRPVREPAKVVRIWIAPWVDKADNLNLASYQFAEIKPRTWSVGKPEATASGYVIPHQATSVVNVVEETPAAPKRATTSVTPSDSMNPFKGSDNQNNSSVTPFQGGGANPTGGYNLPR